METSRGELGAGHLRGRQHPLQQRLRVALGAGDAHAHRAALAEVAGQGAGVDAGDADDALLAEVVVERPGGAPARRHAGRVAHDVAADPDAAGLGVLVVHAGVADVRGGHHHDLAVVRRIGQRLLVAGHAGREHRFAERLADGAEAVAAEGPAVLEDEERLHLGLRCVGMLWHAVPPSPPHGTVVKGCRSWATLPASVPAVGRRHRVPLSDLRTTVAAVVSVVSAASQRPRPPVGVVQHRQRHMAHIRVNRDSPGSGIGRSRPGGRSPTCPPSCQASSRAALAS